MSAAALILQHGDWGPPDLLGEWARERGIPVEVHCAHLGEPLPQLEHRPFVVSLGSDLSPLDRHLPVVADELELLGRAVQADVPVLGLCYGGQMLATVLGGRTEAAPEPELGWHRVESEDPAEVPEGPWLQWHYHRFTLPPGARALAHSPRALQAFSHGRHLGVQFHPESTIETVQEWARLDAERVATLGIPDPPGMVEQGREHAAAAREAAFRLFDAFWERARR